MSGHVKGVRTFHGYENFSGVSVPLMGGRTCHGQDLSRSGLVNCARTCHPSGPSGHVIGVTTCHG